MTRYLIYGENNKKPIRKTKHENDAFMFIADFKNLQQHGCMTIIREEENDGRQMWDPELMAWVNMDGDTSV